MWSVAVGHGRFALTNGAAAELEIYAARTRDFRRLCATMEW